MFGERRGSKWITALHGELQQNSICPSVCDRHSASGDSSASTRQSVPFWALHTHRRGRALLPSAHSESAHWRPSRRRTRRRRDSDPNRGGDSLPLARRILWRAISWAVVGPAGYADTVLQTPARRPRPRRGETGLTFLLNRFWADNSANDIAEYAIIAALLLVVVMAVLRYVTAFA